MDKKRKNGKVSLITIKKDLDAVKKSLSGFATKDDLKRFATKDDLQSFATATRMDIIKFKDEILTELVKMRENMEILTYRYPEMRDNIENHEIRIVKLETSVFTNA